MYRYAVSVRVSPTRLKNFKKMNTVKNMRVYIQKLPLVYKIVVGVCVVGAVALVVRGVVTPKVETATISDTTHVTIASVASLSDKAGPLPVTGKVTSKSKANILAISSGEIVSLSRALGDYVAAGATIASFENSSQRASVLQAQGAYEAAQSALSKTSGSSAQNSNLTSAQATQNAQNATVAANAAIKSAYASLEDAVHTKADTLFSNPHGSTPSFNVISYDSQLVTRVVNQRVQLDVVLDSIHTISNTSEDANVDARITTVIAKAQIIEAFLNDVVDAVNKAIPTQNISASTIAGYQTLVAAARTEVLGSISSLTGAKGAYDNAVSGATVAANSANDGTSNDIASAQANVKSALGALYAAQANLEKTIVRAPISGTIVSLPITRGGYVAAYSPVAQISNPGALEVETYVTSDDAKTLAVGGKAVIEGTTQGIIVFIAPAIDPSTGKIQVKIGLPGEHAALTDGNTVTVVLNRLLGGLKSPAKNTITIPIAAAKLTPNGPVVFIVSSSTLVSKPITFGKIVGSQVSVVSGLVLDMDIVTDARGLSDGQKVIIDQTK